MYVAYKCTNKDCGVTFIIPSNDVERMELAGKYIACNFGHKFPKKIGKYDDLLECMRQSYSCLT